MHLSLRSLPLAALVALTAMGCASSSTSTAPTAEASVPREAPAPTKRQEVTLHSGVATVLTPVYFDTDVANLHSQARAALRAHAEAILAHPEWGVIALEGHCDERGSEEYNLALGERRAAATKRYLMDLGVPAARLTTVTFGENRPAVRGHDETAWRKNRRSELKSEALRSAQR